jgi:hypothetical protein
LIESKAHEDGLRFARKVVRALESAIDVSMLSKVVLEDPIGTLESAIDVSKILEYPIQVRPSKQVLDFVFTQVQSAVAAFKRLKFPEAKDIVSAMKVEERRSRGPTPARVQVWGGHVYLDRKLIPLNLTAEKAKEARRYLKLLSKDWQSDAEIGKLEPALKGIRLDRLRKSLPPRIKALIESNRRKGSRWLA